MSVVVLIIALVLILLAVVVAGWSQLHERLGVAVSHVQKLGANLEWAVKSYNDFVGSFESRVMTSARRFEEMGSASPKSLPESLDSVDTVPREILDSGSR